MNDYTNFRIALNEIVRILSPHSRPDAKRAMASKLATAARGEVIENLSFRYSEIGHIFFPDNEPAALVLTEQISTARQSGELASIIPIGDGLLPTDLITWPACPLVSAKNPLSYWLPVTTAPTGTQEKQDASGVDRSDKPNVTVHKLRQNSLDAPIRKAMENAKSRSVGTVFVHLRELALNGEIPFTGAFEGAAICYTNDDGEPAKLSKDALRKRIENL